MQARRTRYEGFPVDTGTVTASRLLDPDGHGPLGHGVVQPLRRPLGDGRGRRGRGAGGRRPAGGVVAVSGLSSGLIPRWISPGPRTGSRTPSTTAGTARCSTRSGPATRRGSRWPREYSAAGAGSTASSGRYAFLAGCGRGRRPGRGAGLRPGVGHGGGRRVVAGPGREDVMAQGSGVHRGRGLRADLRRGGRDGEGDRGRGPRGRSGSAAAWSPWPSTGDLATVEEAVEIGEEVARAISGRAVKSIVFASPCAAGRRARRRHGDGRGADRWRTNAAHRDHRDARRRGAGGGHRGDDEDRRRADHGRRAGQQRLPRRRRPRARWPRCARPWRPGPRPSSSTASCARPRCTRSRTASRRRCWPTGAPTGWPGPSRRLVILGEVVGRVWSERQHDGLGRAAAGAGARPGVRRAARRGRPAGRRGRDDGAAGHRRGRRRGLPGSPSVDAAVVALVAGYDGQPVPDRADR